jgi:hypothetical protein
MGSRLPISVAPLTHLFLGIAHGHSPTTSAAQESATMAPTYLSSRPIFLRKALHSLDNLTRL